MLSEKTFNITVEMLKEKGACMGGMRDFLKAFPKEKYPDGADYQEILNSCAENKEPGYASWLLDAFGSTKTVLQLNEISTEGYIFFSGSVEVKAGIKCLGINAGEGINAGWGINAGEGINADGGIKAGEGINAGLGINAGEGIKAGKDYGIYAGLSVRLSKKKEYAKITAKEKPENIICGEWEENNA